MTSAAVKCSEKERYDSCSVRCLRPEELSVGLINIELMFHATIVIYWNILEKTEKELRCFKQIVRYDACKIIHFYMII